MQTIEEGKLRDFLKKYPMFHGNENILRAALLGLPPMQFTDYKGINGWLSPRGDLYVCVYGMHTWLADYLVKKVICGIRDEYGMERAGWVRLQVHPEQCGRVLTDGAHTPYPGKITDEQWDVLRRWCNDNQLLRHYDELILRHTYQQETGVAGEVLV